MFADIYRTEPTRRRECLYFLAVGHYKLGNYEEAKRYNGALLRRAALGAGAEATRVAQVCSSRRNRPTCRHRASRA